MSNDGMEVYTGEPLPRALEDAATLRIIEEMGLTQSVLDGDAAFKPQTVIFERGTRHPDGTVDYERAEFHDPGMYR